ncbi:MAG TPA: acyl carrier protein [Rhizomicrobium sp.]|jgi:acyl carrier protein|nr:acyl carrier protein [Rhizomicrobium sp.]
MRMALQEIFVNEMGVKPSDFTDDLIYNSIPEWDSQSHLILILAVEEKFNISLEPEDVVSMTTVRKIVDLLQSKGVAVERHSV